MTPLFSRTAALAALACALGGATGATLAASASSPAGGVPVAGPVALLTPVLFDPSTDARSEVRDQCRLGELLATRVGTALRRANKGPGTTESKQGDVVQVTVTVIWGARGNSWTGPKGLGLRADLLHDGVLQRSSKMHRTTMGGIWGTFKGICSFMERDVDRLGKDVAAWVRDPGYVVPDEGPAESVPASGAEAETPPLASAATATATPASAVAVVLPASGASR